MNRYWALIWSATLLFVCSSVAIAGQPLILGSGSSVEILSVGPLQSTQGWSALVLKYQTGIPLIELKSLRDEVNEIWDRFVVDVEHGNFQSAIISANEPAKGPIVTTNNSYNFIFQKTDGSWRTLESKERATAKLDPDFVREFVERVDRTLDNNEMRALLLYLANDWTITIIGPDGDTSGPRTMDRMRFVSETYAAFKAASHRQHHREITAISVGDGAVSAQVESRETEEITVNDRRISGVERSTDLFELRGNVMLWTKSTSVVERQTETREN